MKAPTRIHLSPTFAGIALGLVVAELLSGIAEAFAYHASVQDAYPSVSAMRSSHIGAFTAGVHYWGSAALLLAVALLLLALLWEHGYSDKLKWYGSLGLSVAAFASQVTGNLLPMDRHGVQTAVVESGIAGSAPGFGPIARSFMLAGAKFDAPTLTRWWLGHAWILPVLAVVCGFAVWRSVRPKMTAPAAALVGLAFVAMLVPAPLGNAAMKVDYGQYHASVSWYTWPFHGLLTAFSKLSSSDGWIGAVAIPTGVFLLLLLLPWLEDKLSKKLIRVGTAVAVIAGLGVALAFGGAVADLTGNRDPAPLAATGGSGKASTNPRILQLVATGHQLFNSVGCAGCHGKDGINGNSGPDLNEEYKQHSDPQFFVKLIRNPKSVTPSATMPAFPKLADDQVLAIGTFLANPPAK